MKRFWLILLTLGLIAAFSTSALAVDVKVSGSFYAAGMYQDKTTLMKGASEGPSTAFYYQRLRVQAEFIVSPGLKLVTRFDALERSWGATRSAATTATYNSATGVTTYSAALAPDSAGTRAENENIVFDWAYIDYTSPIGQFKVGYLQTGGWGTEFGNNTHPVGQIYWGKYFPSVALYPWIQIVKRNENSLSAVNSSATASDRDNNGYMIGLNYYGIKNVEIGFLGELDRYASSRGYTYYGYDFNYVSTGYLLGAYTKAKFGPVRVEAEVNYTFGDFSKYDSGVHDYFSVPDMRLNQLTAYLRAEAALGPAYVGGVFAYVQGDDPGTTHVSEGGWVNGGRDFQPCLIMFNWERTYWTGTTPGYNAGASTTGISYGSLDSPMQNAWFGQLFGGVKPIDKLDIKASVSYATADKKPTAAWQYNDYGYELDLTATYKITNNLSYMLGGGYLFTGKYFKGTNDSNELRDNFLVLNKLTLTF